MLKKSHEVQMDGTFGVSRLCERWWSWESNEEGSTEKESSSKRGSTCSDLRSGKLHYSLKRGDYERLDLLMEVRGVDDT